MKKELSDLIEISQFYGKQKDYTLGGGGNTSYKDKDLLYIKASGHTLATITVHGFSVLKRAKLREMQRKQYNANSQIRENEVKEDLLKARVNADSNLRPSVETLLHDSIEYAYVVHTHPHMVNGLLCSKQAENKTKEIFGNKILFIPYTDPGMILSRTVLKYLEGYRKTHTEDPNLIFLENHGVFVAADSVKDIKTLYEFIQQQLLNELKEVITISDKDISLLMQGNLNILRAYLPERISLAVRFNSLIQHFTLDDASIDQITRPFVPDQIVYCKAYPLIIPLQSDSVRTMQDLKIFFREYYTLHSYEPKIILFEGGPMVGLEENRRSAELALDVFEDAMRISFYSNFFGGPKFMTDPEIAFIENWEAENYRRKIAKI